MMRQPWVISMHGRKCHNLCGGIRLKHSKQTELSSKLPHVNRLAGVHRGDFRLSQLWLSPWSWQRNRCHVLRAENAGTFRIIGDGNRLHTHTHVTMQPMKQHSRGRETLCTVLLMRFVLTFDSGWKRQRFSARGQNFFILFCPETVNLLS